MEGLIFGILRCCLKSYPIKYLPRTAAALASHTGAFRELVFCPSLENRLGGRLPPLRHGNGGSTRLRTPILYTTLTSQ